MIRVKLVYVIPNENDTVFDMPDTSIITDAIRRRYGHCRCLLITYFRRITYTLVSIRFLCWNIFIIRSWYCLWSPSNDGKHEDFSFIFLLKWLKIDISWKCWNSLVNDEILAINEHQLIPPIELIAFFLSKSFQALYGLKSSKADPDSTLALVLRIKQKIFEKI